MSLPLLHVQLQPDGHLVLYAEPQLKNEIARFKPWQPRPRKSDRFFTINRKRYKLKWQRS